MNPPLKRAFEHEMARAHAYRREGDPERAFGRLQRAHVLGQFHVLPHVRVHWAMLVIGIERRSPAQIAGQFLRIVLGALGSAIGKVPEGNTGGTDVPMLAKMPVAPELARILRKDRSGSSMSRKGRPRGARRR